MQWYIMYRNICTMVYENTDLRGEERIKAGEIKLQNGHVYEHNLKNLKLK